MSLVKSLNAEPSVVATFNVLMAAIFPLSQDPLYRVKVDLADTDFESEQKVQLQLPSSRFLPSLELKDDGRTASPAMLPALLTLIDRDVLESRFELTLVRTIFSYPTGETCCTESMEAGVAV